MDKSLKGRKSGGVGQDGRFERQDSSSVHKCHFGSANLPTRHPPEQSEAIPSFRRRSSLPSPLGSMSLFRKKSYSKTSSSDSSSPSAPSEPPPETPSPAHPSSSRFFRSPSSPAVSSASSSPASTVGEGSASRNRRVSLKSLFSGSRKSFRRTPSTSGTSPLQVDRSSVGGSIVEPTGDSAHGRLRRSNSSSSAEEGGFGTVVEVGPGRIDEVRYALLAAIPR
jgi:hypothetical protein